MIRPAGFSLKAVFQRDSRFDGVRRIHVCLLRLQESGSFAHGSGRPSCVPPPGGTPACCTITDVSQ